MSNDIELQAIADLVKRSREYGLEVECIWSLVHEIAGIAVGNDQVDSEDIAKACNHALCEWDI
ncbi:MAG TPA: hypothetical protein EYN67_06100 [Flavobacteriales bacterium]|nr:hypothetical protein [Flavobacteriales bacterium]